MAKGTLPAAAAQHMSSSAVEALSHTPAPIQLAEAVSAVDSHTPAPVQLPAAAAQHMSSSAVEALSHTPAPVQDGIDKLLSVDASESKGLSGIIGNGDHPDSSNPGFEHATPAIPDAVWEPGNALGESDFLTFPGHAFFM